MSGFFGDDGFFFLFGEEQLYAVLRILLLWEPKQVLYHLNGRTPCATGGFYSVPKLKKSVEEIFERHGLIILEVIHEKV